MTCTRYIAWALLFALVALHGRRNARAVIEPQTVAGTPIAGLLHTRGAR